MVVFVALAAGYVALGLYGKYRKLMEDFHEARAERELLRQMSEEESQNL